MQRWTEQPLAAVTLRSVEQTGPSASAFEYIDISSVDNTAKAIVQPKTLPRHGAPTRARQVVRNGDVLVSMTRPNLNAVARISDRFDGAIASTGFQVLRPSDSVMSQWLFYYVQSQRFIRAMTDKVLGVLYPAVRPKDILTHLIPVPPIDEQRSIVSEIEAHFTRLEAAVLSLKDAQAKLELYRAALLTAAVTGRLAAAGIMPKEAEPASDLLKRLRQTLGRSAEDIPLAKSDFGPAWTLPHGWGWCHASEICERIESGSTPAATEMADSGDVPFIKVYNLTKRGLLDFSIKPTFVRLETHNKRLARSRLRPGDILINIVGPPLGKVAVVPDTFPEWNMNQAVVMFRPIVPDMGAFLKLALMSPPVIRRLARTSKATAGQFNISLTACRSLPLPLPPSNEQHRLVGIVDRLLSVAEVAECQVVENLRRAAHLRMAVLRSAFNGSLAATGNAVNV